ncbi:hypothetical protein Tco_0380100, partial [Tanacetum coccineum]
LQQYTRNRGKSIVTSSAPTYDPEPATVTEDEEMSKEKEIEKLMALISLFRSRKSTNLPTTTFELHQTPVLRLCRSLGFSVITARNMGMYQGNVRKQEEAGVQLNAEQADWKDDIDDESEEQE